MKQFFFFMVKQMHACIQATFGTWCLSTSTRIWSCALLPIFLSVALQHFKMSGLVNLWLFFFLEVVIKRSMCSSTGGVAVAEYDLMSMLLMPRIAARQTWNHYFNSPGKEKSLLTLFVLRYWKAQSFHLILVPDAENPSAMGRQSVCQDLCWLQARAVVFPCTPRPADPTLARRLLGHWVFGA